MNNIIAILIKEYYQIIRDPSSIIIAFVLPIVLILLFTYGVSLDMNNLKIGMYVEDNSPQVQSFIKAFTNSRFFNVRFDNDKKRLYKALTAGEIRGIVIIPSNFTAKLLDGVSTAPIEVIADGSEPNTASFVQNYASSAWSCWISQQAIDNGVKLSEKVSANSRYWYNPELESKFFLLPGSLAIIMTLIGTLLTALVIAREWERGTMEAIMATPITIVELLIGKLIPYFVLGMFSMLISVAIITHIFKVPFRGTFVILLLVSAIFMFASLGQGLLISTVSRNQFTACQMALITGFLPAFMLSGFIFEITSMPVAIQTITHLITAKYLIKDLQSLFLVGDVWAILIPNTLIMLFMGLILFLITASKTVKRLD